MKFPRIQPYKTSVVDDDGKRTRLEAHEIVLERPIGVDLEVNLAPHPRFRGRVTFSTFGGAASSWSPTLAMDLHLFIENWPRGDRRRKEDRRRKRTPLGHVYAVDARGEKSASSARSFAVQVGRGLELKVDLTPQAPWAHHVHIQTFEGPLALFPSAQRRSPLRRASPTLARRD